MKTLLACVLLVGVFVAWFSFAPKPSPAKRARDPQPAPSTPASVVSAAPAKRPIIAAAHAAAALRRNSDDQILKNASREELLAYARDLLANGGPLEDVVALLEYLVRSKPEFAIDLARDIGRSDGERQVLLYAALSAWAQQDATAALQWAFQKADAYTIPGNASLLYIALEEVAGDSPRAAVALAESGLRSDAALSSRLSGADVARLTLEALIKTGHGDLAQEAMERWARGPESAHLDSADYEVIAMKVAQASLEQGGAWLQSLPRSPGRNEAYASFATTWEQQDPRAAMDWAQALDPADGGDDVRVATFARWVKDDRFAAAQWLRTHDKPDPGRLAALLGEDTSDR
jgi:hypothetical protein